MVFGSESLPNGFWFFFFLFAKSNANGQFLRKCHGITKRSRKQARIEKMRSSKFDFCGVFSEKCLILWRRKPKFHLITIFLHHGFQCSHSRAQKQCNQQDICINIALGQSFSFIICYRRDIFVIKFGVCAMIWVARSLHDWQKQRKKIRKESQRDE